MTNIRGRQALKGPYEQFIALLKTSGCVFCPTCFAYVRPQHTAHVDLAGDWGAANVVVVGSYGNVRAVDLRVEAAA